MVRIKLSCFFCGSFITGLNVNLTISQYVPKIHDSCLTFSLIQGMHIIEVLKRLIGVQGLLHCVATHGCSWPTCGAKQACAAAGVLCPQSVDDALSLKLPTAGSFTKVRKPCRPRALEFTLILIQQVPYPR